MCRISDLAPNPACCGKLTDDYLRAIRAAWENDEDYRSGRIPIRIGGNSNAGIRRAVRLGEAWHPLRFTMPWLHEAVDRMSALAAAAQLRLLGADTVVLDPFNGHPDETRHPEVAWQALAAASTGTRHLRE